VFFVLMLIPGVDEHIIQIHQDKLANERAEDVIHESLKGGRCVAQAKREDFELVLTKLCAKSSLVLISILDLHLVITRVQV